MSGEERGSKVLFEDTTVAQKLKLGEELDRLNTEMKQLVAQFAHDCSDIRARSLYEAQQEWENYRRAEGEFSSLLFESGTAAPLLGMSRMLELTQQRIQDLRLAMAQSRS